MQLSGSVEDWRSLAVAARAAQMAQCGAFADLLRAVSRSGPLRTVAVRVLAMPPAAGAAHFTQADSRL